MGAVHIPDDIAFSVLCKLPLKSIKRFSCVHKSWSLLFENPYFMTNFRHSFISDWHSYHHDSCLLLKQTEPKEPIDFNCVFYDENMVKLDCPLFYDNFHNVEWYFLGSAVNGILCLSQHDQTVLWNPKTHEFEVLPPSLTGIKRLHGFGYDKVSDDYKIICTVAALPKAWEIYSLRSDSWRKLDIDMPPCDSKPIGADVYLNGMCHWGGEKDGFEMCLVSFELSKEFLTTPLPDLNDPCPEWFATQWLTRHLVVLKGSIAFISNSSNSTSTFHISILGELGVKESWVRLFTIGPLPYAKQTVGFCREDTLGIGKKGDILFKKGDNELAWFDLRTEMIKDIGIRGQWLSSQIVIYKESLLPIGGRNN
ncbi:putative F-box protein At5g15660 [Abrus precatorius]|uniref:F-box protein At5g15660 n=1 Tax=Abrus precatorius TaxID=3816 RepID=A0A8B8KWZ6_ABRPR|nr:putative F-box protein At5g15660 [Abrus precatorius]